MNEIIDHPTAIEFRARPWGRWRTAVIVAALAGGGFFVVAYPHEFQNPVRSLCLLAILPAIWIGVEIINRLTTSLRIVISERGIVSEQRHNITRIPWEYITEIDVRQNYDTSFVYTFVTPDNSIDIDLSLFSRGDCARIREAIGRFLPATHRDESVRLANIRRIAIGAIIGAIALFCLLALFELLEYL